MPDAPLTRWLLTLWLEIRHRPLLPFLLAATVAIDALVIARQWEETALVTTAAQIGLLAVWVGKLRPNWLPRLIAATFGVVVSSVVYVGADRPEPVVPVLTVFGGFFAAVAMIGVTGRLVGKLINHRAGEVRFSVGGMFAASTLLCCLAALLKLAELPQGLDLYEFGAMFGAWAIPPLVGYPLCRILPSSRLTFIGVIAVTLVAWAMFIRIDPAGVWFSYALWQGVFIGVWLTGVRVKRQRVRRPYRLPEPTAPPPLRIATPDPTPDPIPEEAEAKLDPA